MEDVEGSTSKITNNGVIRRTINQITSRKHKIRHKGNKRGALVEVSRYCIIAITHKNCL